MNHTFQKILIVCPARAVTAGPEALHQLAALLNKLGQPAAMVYHPFHEIAKTPEVYLPYHVPVERYQDAPGIFILFPEIMPVAALKVKYATAGIWWMSVNNYTCVRYINRFRDKIRYLKNLLKGKRPWFGMKTLKSLRHFAQSHYAYLYLQAHGIAAQMLSDSIPYYTETPYLNALAPKQANAIRQNIILYNPKKGRAVIKKLMQTFPTLSFKPLQNLNRTELAESFLTAKVYVDFGHHPGKDRLPREAALHGVCVITGLYGSSENSVDVPILARYKLNPNATDFTAQFFSLVADIFNHFSACQDQFQEYRAIIAKEPHLFQEQIIAAFHLREV